MISMNRPEIGSRPCEFLFHYRFGAFMKEWDTAAMQVICEEAGASFTDLHGRPVRANREDPVNRDGFIILNRPESALTIPDGLL